VGARSRRAKAEEDFKERLSERLWTIRNRRAMTQEELAERAGVAVATVTKVELGRTRPHPGTLRKLADALDCNVEDLTS
jgi:transcriptional regulator with XRE-family HTH domain